MVEKGADDLVRPPSLDPEADRTTTRLELFYDLAFVLAVAAAAHHYSDSQTLPDAAVLAGVFSVIWWSWASTTLYANRFDTDDLIYRVFKLTAMLTATALAATAADAVGSDSGRFALCYVASRVVLLLLYARAWRHVRQAGPHIRTYAMAHAAGGALWLGSLLVPTPARYAVWAVGLLLEMSAPLRATVVDDVPLHVEHLPERFGLFVILVLGEAVAGVTVGVHDAKWSGASTGVAVLAFVVAAALWWIYFDLTGASAKQRLLDEGASSQHRIHDLYLFAHLPLTLGIVLTSVGLEHAITEAGHSTLETATRWSLAGGVALYLAAATALQAGMSGWRAGLPWPGIGVPVMLLLGMLPMPPAATVAAIALVLVVEIGVGVRRERRGELRTAEL